MAVKIGDAVLMIGADTSKLDKSLKNIGNKMTSVGKNLTMKLTAPLALFGGLAVKTAADFSRAMAKVNAVTGATTEQFEELNEVAKELGRTTQFTATQVAEAMTFMAMAGMETNQILAAIPATLNLAAAGALDMGSAANIVTNILAGFGMTTDQLGGAVDVLAKTFTSSNVDLLMLGESMKFAAPVAKGFGMTFEETAAIMGIFGNAGIQASLAGTSLRGAIVQLNNKAADFGITMYNAAGKMLPMANILEQLEAKGMTAGEMMDLFGLRAGPAMTALLSVGSDALRAFTTELENSGGTAQEIAEKQMEGLHGSLTRLKSAFEGLQLAIVDQIAPMLEGLIEKLKGLFNWFSNLPGPIKKMAITVGILLALLGPFLLITGSIINAFITLKTVLTVANAKLVIYKIQLVAAKVASWAMTVATAALSIGLGTLVLVVAALTLGISMLVFGISKLISQGKQREEQQKLEAEAERINIRLKEEHAKAIQGLDNEYVELLKEAKALGLSIGAEGEALLQNIEISGAYQESMQGMTDAMDTDTEATVANINAKIRLMDITKQMVAAGITYDVARAIAAESRRLAYGTGGVDPYTTPGPPGGYLEQYAGGGPILGPSVISSLATGLPYAIAGEGRQQEWVGQGGGYRTANIYFQVDGRTLAQVMGEPLVEEIRLSTGIKI